MGTAFSIISALFMVSVVVFYFRQVYNSQSTPNPATWLVWIVVMSMNTATYYFVAGGKFLSIITPLVIIVGMMVIMAYAAGVSRTGKMSFLDGECLVLSGIVMIFWVVSENAFISNMMMQVVLMISYIPTIVGLAQNRLKERPLPWNLAVLSYVFMILSALSTKEWTIGELVYPTINGIIGNGSIPVILWIKKRRQRWPIKRSLRI